MGLLKRSKILFHCYVAHLPVLQLLHPRARTTAPQTHTRTRSKRLLRATRSGAFILTNNGPCVFYATFSISSVVCTQLHCRQLDLNWNCRFCGEIGWRVDQLGSSGQQTNLSGHFLRVCWVPAFPLIVFTCRLLFDLLFLARVIPLWSWRACLVNLSLRCWRRRRWCLKMAKAHLTLTVW